MTPDSYTINSGESGMMLRESMNKTEKQWMLANETEKRCEPTSETKKQRNEIKKQWKPANGIKEETMGGKPAAQSVTTSKCKQIFSKMLKIWDEWKQKMKADQPKEDWLVVRPEDDVEEAASVNVHAQIHPTICLTDYREHPEGLLLYEGYEHFDNIRLGEKTVQVGQSEESDIKIAKDTISRIHARIEYREEEYYLEDLNSTNGTFVNDEPLSYKQETRLKTNDIVRFADVKYRFV